MMEKANYYNLKKCLTSELLSSSKSAYSFFAQISRPGTFIKEWCRKQLAATKRNLNDLNVKQFKRAPNSDFVSE